MNDKIIRIRRTPDGEERREFKALVLAQDHMTLPKNSDVDEDDLVEWTNPAGHRKLLRVTNVNFLNAPRGSGSLDHTEVRLEAASKPRPSAPIPPMSITGMHPGISTAAAALFADGYYSQAVFEAFKAVEARVKSLSPIDQSGKKLMSQTFGASEAKLDVATTTGQSAIDEREGFNHLFMGAIQGLRDPRGHGHPLNDTAEEAIEYLALASLLMRRLDVAERRIRSGS